MVRRGIVLLVLGLVLLANVGCQVKATVDVDAAADGSGTVTVALGLDDAALARVGDIDRELRLDDMRATGWTITPAAKGPEGMTWVKATKPFADSAALARTMEDLGGAGGPFRGFASQVTDDDAATTRRVTGTVDLTGGLAALGDPALAASLGGDALGGRVAEIEKAEGRPVADMVTVEVRASVPGAAPVVIRPTLRDTSAATIEAVSVDPKPQRLWFALAAGAIVLVAVVMLVGVRRRFRRVSP